MSWLLQCPPGGLPEEQVRAELSPAYDRRPLSEGDKAIAAIWESRLQAQPWLFDASKFRLHSVTLAPTGSPGPRLLLRLGLTSYRDFLGTNWSSSAAWLQQQGAADWGDKQAYLADPLGVGAALVTADDFLVFLRRSQQVAEAPGLVDVPGGHPEPQVRFQTAHKDPDGSAFVFLISRRRNCPGTSLKVSAQGSPLASPLFPAPDLWEAREWGQTVSWTSGCPSGIRGPKLGDHQHSYTVPQKAIRTSKYGEGRAGISGEQGLSLTSHRPCALVTAPCTKTSLESWWYMSSSPVSSKRSVMR